MIFVFYAGFLISAGNREFPDANREFFGLPAALSAHLYLTTTWI